jgi:hypothetical protein
MASFSLVFDNISNADALIGGSSSDINVWNTFLDLPNNGTPINNVSVDVNTVILAGGANIHLKDSLFANRLALLSISDTNCIVSAGDQCFYGCTSVNTLNLPTLATAGDQCFYGCNSINTFELPLLLTAGNSCFGGCTAANSFNLSSCTNLGTDLGNNNVFYNISGGNISLTIPAALMTINGGNPDGDISDLYSRNYINYNLVYYPLELTFNDIANADTLIGGSSTDVSFWNAFFDLPNNGTAFTSVEVLDSTVKLFGGANIHLKDDIFNSNLTLISVNDILGCIVSAGFGCFNACTSATSFNLPSLANSGAYLFYSCTSATSFNLPSLISVVDSCFNNCIAATFFNLSSCVNLGSTADSNFVFANNIGNTISLTIPIELMTVNGGNPDGDIQYLQANNTVNITEVVTTTTTTTTTTTLPPTTTTTTTTVSPFPHIVNSSTEYDRIIIHFNTNVYEYMTLGSMIIFINGQQSVKRIPHVYGTTTITIDTDIISYDDSVSVYIPQYALADSSNNSVAEGNYAINNTVPMSTTSTTTTTTTTLPPVPPKRKVQPKLFADRDPLNTDNALTFISVGQMWHNNITGDEFYHKFDGEWVALGSGSGGGIIEILYDDLYTLYDNGEFVAGQQYLLTDYMTTYTRPVTNENIESGFVEPLLLTAISSRAINPICSSIIRTDDIIYYQIPNNSIGSTKGIIYRRIDTVYNNDVYTDWRNIKYRRWAVTVPNAWNVNDIHNSGDLVYNSADNSIYICAKDGVTGGDPNNDYDNWFNTGIKNGSYISSSSTNFPIQYNGNMYNLAVNAGIYLDFLMMNTESSVDIQNNVIISGYDVLPNIVIDSVYAKDIKIVNSSDITIGYENSMISIDSNNEHIVIGSGNHNISIGAGNNNITIGSNNHSVAITNYNNDITIGNDNCTLFMDEYNNSVTIGSNCDTVIISVDNNSVLVSGGVIEVNIGSYNNGVRMSSNCFSVYIQGENSNIFIGSNTGNIFMSTDNSNIIFGTNCAYITFDSSNRNITFGDNVLKYNVNNAFFNNSTYFVPAQVMTNKRYKLYGSVNGNNAYMSYIDNFDDINIIDITI